MRFHFKAKLYDIEIQAIPNYLITGIERYEYVLKQLGFINADGDIWNRYKTPVNSIDLCFWQPFLQGAVIASSGLLTIKLNRMKKYNINEYIYIQITESGWEHLRKTVGEEYIKHYITADGYKREINGEVWYRLQCWGVFDLFPSNFGGQPLFNTNVMFDDEALT